MGIKKAGRPAFLFGLRVADLVSEIFDRIAELDAGIVVFIRHAEDAEHFVHQLHERAKNGLELVKEIFHWNQSSCKNIRERSVSHGIILTYCEGKGKRNKGKRFVVFVNFLSSAGTIFTKKEKVGFPTFCAQKILFVQCGLDSVD